MPADALNGWSASRVSTRTTQKKVMSQSIDEQIAGLERQLEQLRRRKLETLQKEMAALQASLLNPGAAPARRGRPPGSASRPRTGRGSRGPRLKEDEVLERLRAAVADAGPDGISATDAAAQSGVFYPRAMRLMPKHFKRSGKGKWTRYRLK